ncbi:MAG: DUF1707 domain-containing protein [Solirubrobacterales bacterium]|nr:DUF1707 domain-containing protein [Solirubrobacterales bacterium]
MARRGSLRASDSDRDRIVERLRRAAGEGRLLAEELEERVSRALIARTYDELEATVHDLPRPDSPHRHPRRRSAGGWALHAVRAHPSLLVLVIPCLAVTAAMLLATAIVWTVMMIVVLALGGRPRRPREPRGPRARGWDPQRRRSGWGPRYGDWA